MANNFMWDGYSTWVTFSILPEATFYLDKSVTPPSVDTGGGIDITNMWDEIFRPKWHKSLVTMGDVSLRVIWDSAMYERILSVLAGVPCGITVNLPDGSHLYFWGFLDKFTPDEHREGELPLATMTIVIMNVDPNSFLEDGIVYTPPA